MGTRRSRHNKGRKPLYKEHRLNIPDGFDPFKVPGVDGNHVVSLEKQAAIEATLVANKPLRDVGQETGVNRGTVNTYASILRNRLTFERAKNGPVRFRGRYTVETDATAILAVPRFMDGLLLNNRTTWSDEDKQRLKILCDHKADIEKSAIALGRPETSLAHQARLMRLHLPPEWGALTSSRLKSPRREALCYPYIAKARQDNADLASVHSLLPRALPEWIRADVCQSIMLALWEGQTTFEELKKNADKVRWFIKRFHHEQMPYQEILSSQDDDDDRPYYDSADVKTLWQEHDRDQARLSFDSLHRRASMPTQEDDVYASELTRYQERFHENGKFHSLSEIADDLDDQRSDRIGRSGSISSGLVLQASEKRMRWSSGLIESSVVSGAPKT